MSFKDASKDNTPAGCSASWQPTWSVGQIQAGGTVPSFEQLKQNGQQEELSTSPMHDQGYLSPEDTDRLVPLLRTELAEPPAEMELEVLDVEKLELEEGVEATWVETGVSRLTLISLSDSSPISSSTAATAEPIASSSESNRKSQQPFAVISQPVDKKASTKNCQARFTDLIKKFKQEEMESLRASGTEEEYSEREQLLTDLVDLASTWTKKSTPFLTNTQKLKEAEDAKLDKKCKKAADDDQREVNGAKIRDVATKRLKQNQLLPAITPMMMMGPSNIFSFLIWYK
ncbi:UNVERIFIED_CONTAM: hypothetical protein HDU68_008732 [Siphonaria sp. JEL0065]|nr:hypothetical protein HDU68_008732 [Siphonaria sp. JEL0065]